MNWSLLDSLIDHAVAGMEKSSVVDLNNFDGHYYNFLNHFVSVEMFLVDAVVENCIQILDKVDNNTLDKHCKDGDNPSA